MCQALFYRLGYVSEQNKDLFPYRVYTLAGESHKWIIVFKKVTDALEKESRVKRVGSSGLGMALIVFLRGWCDELGDWD